MKAVVDPETCMGCGICETIAPKVFQLGDKPYAIVLIDPIPEPLWADTRQAADECPEQAISIEA
ncbi:MAG: ferredoxin [Anaerolineaceae bacterium]|jgi:ferredoxin|nr:ferredoxin [Ignavibacteriales bacterium]NTV35793.1 ferredoxin [Anaerolineaceae bacterium]